MFDEPGYDSNSYTGPWTSSRGIKLLNIDNTKPVISVSEDRNDPNNYYHRNNYIKSTDQNGGLLTDKKINFSSDFTISFWFKDDYTQTQGQQGGLLKTNIFSIAKNQNYLYLILNNSIVGGAFSDVDYNNNFNSSLNNAWNNLIITRNEYGVYTQYNNVYTKMYSIRCYLNGGEITANSAPLLASVQTNLQLFYNELSPSLDTNTTLGGYIGYIDDLIIWNYTFTEEMVSSYYNRFKYIEMGVTPIPTATSTTTPTPTPTTSRH